MPRYDFKCHICEMISMDVILPITHTDGDLPVCCGEDMRYYITQAPQVMWRDKDLPDGGFVAGKGKERITTKRERREFMARNDLVDANDMYAPPTHEEQMDTHAAVKRTVDAITPDARQKEQMRDDGILDIV